MWQALGLAWSSGSRWGRCDGQRLGAPGACGWGWWEMGSRLQGVPGMQVGPRETVG